MSGSKYMLDCEQVTSDGVVNATAPRFNTVIARRKISENRSLSMGIISGLGIFNVNLRERMQFIVFEISTVIVFTAIFLPLATSRKSYITLLCVALQSDCVYCDILGFSTFEKSHLALLCITCM